MPTTTGTPPTNPPEEIGFTARMRAAARESVAEVRALPGEAVIILLAVPILMTVFWYFGRPGFFQDHIQRHVPRDWPMARMYGFFYFALSSVVLRMLVPLGLIRLMGRRPSDYGFSLPSRFEFSWIYVLLFLAVVPFIAWAASMQTFQYKYPFGWQVIVDDTIPFADFLIYQCFYGLIFVSGESFWRGFVVFGLSRHIGLLAIPVMVIPYCMSHYGKPSAEAFASILAGTILGFLALRHRSFWLGVVIHWGAAISMDLLAIRQRGLPFTFWE
jgi:hypothetical protein